MSMSWKKTQKVGQVTALVCLMVALGGGALAQDTGRAPEVNPFQEFSQGERLANLGGYTKAIPFFERALMASPVQYAVVHYNLGEIYRAKGNCPVALMHYQIFLRKEAQEEVALKRARSAMRQCGPTLADMPSLAVEVAQPEALVRLDRWQLPASATKTPLKLPAGTYTVTVELAGHIPQTRTITLGREAARVEAFDLERQTLFGSLKVSVDVPKATINLVPKTLDKPGSEVSMPEPQVLKAGGAKLPTGKYFLEVTAPGYTRWIRNVYITRENETKVDVLLLKALPPELRAQDAAPR